MNGSKQPRYWTQTRNNLTILPIFLLQGASTIETEYQLEKTVQGYAGPQLGYLTPKEKREMKPEEMAKELYHIYRETGQDAPTGNWNEFREWLSGKVTDL